MKDFLVSESCRRRPEHQTAPTQRARTEKPGPCLNTFDVPEFARCVSQTMHKSHKAQVGQHSLMQTMELFSFLQDLSSSKPLWLTASAEHWLMHLYRTSFSVSAEQFLHELPRLTFNRQICASRGRLPRICKSRSKRCCFTFNLILTNV